MVFTMNDSYARESEIIIVGSEGCHVGSLCIIFANPYES